MIIGGIGKVSQDGLTFPDIFTFIIFISLIVFSIVKLFKHKNLDYKSDKSNNNHKNISNSETTRSNNVQSNSHIKKDNVPHDTEINNSKK